MRAITAQITTTNMRASVMTNKNVVIVDAARTPMGAFQGALSSVTAPQLGAFATQAALQRAGVSNDQVDELLFGCVLPAGIGQAPARQVALGANLALSTRCTTISKVCGSGMKAVMIGHDQIYAGSCELAVTGGMESMSQAPYLLPKVRAGLRMGHGQVVDHMLSDGLEDPASGRSMGSLAQEHADKHGITRDAMDAFAMESLARAQQAVVSGYFRDEITPVNVNQRGIESKIETDQLPKNISPEKLAKLKSAFSKNGTITAGNASSISDGAAALVLMSEAKSEVLGMRPLARIVAHASHAQLPGEFCEAPIEAMRKVLVKAQWQANEVDLFEINEAFAIVTLLAMQAFELDHDKVNINGGGLVLGHPIGASGARIIVTLIYALRRLRLKKGIASLCIGGGEATAIAIEMI